MESPHDAASLDALIPESSTILLAQKHLGRLAVLVEGDIHVVPVNYTLEGSTIVFHAGESALPAEAALQRVTFEVDDIDENARTGWSVELKGVCHEITDSVDAESEHLRALQVDTWAPGAKPRVFKIVPSEVTGRALYANPT